MSGLIAANRCHSNMEKDDEKYLVKSGSSRHRTIEGQKANNQSGLISN